MLKDDKFYTHVGADRIESSQIDELVGLARGLLADGKLVQSEIECLQKWLAVNIGISIQPLVRGLYKRVNDVLSDGVVDADESAELFETLNRFVPGDFDLGESLKSTSLPLSEPEPDLVFPGRRYCF